jgi:hypothetical protein
LNLSVWKRGGSYANSCFGFLPSVGFLVCGRIWRCNLKCFYPRLVYNNIRSSCLQCCNATTCGVGFCIEHRRGQRPPDTFCLWFSTTVWDLCEIRELRTIVVRSAANLSCFSPGFKVTTSLEELLSSLIETGGNLWNIIIIYHSFLLESCAECIQIGCN